MNARDCCVLIPSLEPDEKLTSYVKELAGSGFGMVLVVDDGSGEQYQPVFQEIASWDKCHVLRHPVNRGKGAALKTGFTYILESTGYQGVVTADSDGQHTVKDTLHLADMLSPENDELLLGSRDFSRKSTQVPPKSRMGNRITSLIYCLFYGHWLPDTQTGLRAMNRDLMERFTKTDGDRFEYEMNQLIQCSGEHIKMRAVPIETVYLNENKGTHFHPLRDSWRIYKLLLTGFFKFMSASVAATLIDLGLFTILNRYVLERIMPDASFLFLGAELSTRFLVATGIARVISASLNYKLNKTFVFSLSKCKGAPLRYVLLCVVVMLISGLSVGLLSSALHIADKSFLNTLIKALVDTVLFLINYRVQKAWVFAGSKQTKEMGVNEK